jgi:outer membrane protein OmpA-like peptidoglycan-associated protein
MSKEDYSKLHENRRNEKTRQLEEANRSVDHLKKELELSNKHVTDLKLDLDAERIQVGNLKIELEAAKSKIADTKPKRVMLATNIDKCSLFLVLNGKDVLPDDCKDYGKTTAEGVSTVLVIPQISFDFDSDRLTENSEQNLARVAEAMLDLSSSQQIYQVEGYTDNSGEINYNLNLSKRRAKSVEKSLVKKGVPPNRLRVQGFGAQNFANPDDPYSVENRRVEIVNLRFKNAVGCGNSALP